MKGCAGLPVYMAMAETAVFTVPFFRDCLDTTDPEHLGAKLAVLAIGAVLYAILNILSYRNCVKTFEKVDL